MRLTNVRFKLLDRSNFNLTAGEKRLNIVDLNELKNEISVAITREGKISVVTYPLLSDENGYYFEYGCEYTKLAVDDFKEVSE